MTTAAWDPRWVEAVTLEQLGELVAQWLERRIAVPLQYGAAPPDSETDQLVPVLAQLNRAGFVTDDSQPGEIVGDSAQRAFVTGYCDQDIAERLASVSVREDLVVVSQPTDPRAPFQLPVTRDETNTSTSLSGTYAPCNGDDASWPWPGLRPEMRAVLLDTWYVSVCDPVWGRDDVLWPALTAAMTRSTDDVRGSLIPPPGCIDVSQD